MKKALIVFGGWPGHEPEKCNEILSKFLNSEGYEVRSENSTEAFAEDYVHEMDLIIPIVTMAFHHSPKGEIKKNEVNNLIKAVVNGCGLAGHHGGMCDAFRQSIDWQFLTGGQWVSHPNGIHDYKVNITKKDDPNILYKTLKFSFDKLINGKYIVLPFSEKFEFDNEPVSVYTLSLIHISEPTRPERIWDGVVWV